jgi:glycosyltransferase involved in cell wall biosynthesis
VIVERRELLVSVIAILNEAHFIEEAIDSVLAQSESDWELVLVDDGCADGSSEIARSCAERGAEKIWYLARPEQLTAGMARSRDLGLRAARGRYVAFLDPADTYLQGRLKRGVDILERRPEIDVAQVCHMNWLSWQTKAEREEEDYLQGAVLSSDLLPAQPLALIDSLMRMDTAVGVNSITMRRDVVLARGGFDIAFANLFEEHAFLTKLQLQHATYLLPECVARYTSQRDSIFQRPAAHAPRPRGVYQTAVCGLANWQLQYARSKGCADPLSVERLQLKVRVARKSSLPRQGWWILLAGSLRLALSWFLPSRIYLSLFKRRRRASEHALWLRYTAACNDRAETDAHRASADIDS